MQTLKHLHAILDPMRVTSGKGFSLAKHDPAALYGFHETDKKQTQQKLEEGVKRLLDLQDRYYADQRKGLLIVLQALDAAGKDGTIKHVIGAINPQGCRVTGFKKPTPKEHSHDFLWRCAYPLPSRGMISIYNRSYYEEVLAVKVHPEWLTAEGFSPKDAGKKFWKHRYESISDFEKHLTRNNVDILKIYLHLSYKEQRNRFLSRIDTPAKNWKISPADMEERAYWKDYQKALDEMIVHTATKAAPWYVVPADNKWFSRFSVLCILTHYFLTHDPRYPEVSPELAKQFPAMKRKLEQD